MRPHRGILIAVPVLLGGFCAYGLLQAAVGFGIFEPTTPIQQEWRAAHLDGPLRIDGATIRLMAVIQDRPPYVPYRQGTTVWLEVSNPGDEPSYVDSRAVRLRDETDVAAVSVAGGPPPYEDAPYQRSGPHLGSYAVPAHHTIEMCIAFRAVGLRHWLRTPAVLEILDHEGPTMMDSAAAPALAAAPIVLEDAAVDLPLPGKAESAHPAPPR